MNINADILDIEGGQLEMVAELAREANAELSFRQGKEDTFRADFGLKLRFAPDAIAELVKLAAVTLGETRQDILREVAENLGEDPVVWS